MNRRDALKGLLLALAPAPAWAGSKPSVTTLSQSDRSMKVRQAALEALKVMG